jgi:hypothetical protein
MFFSSITIMSNATVHKSHRGTMNGLSMVREGRLEHHNRGALRSCSLTSLTTS